MSATAQCQKPLGVGASGSNIVTTKLRVSAGKSLHVNCGERSSPPAPNMPLIWGVGSCSPSATSMLVSVKAGTGASRAKGSHASDAAGVAVCAATDLPRRDSPAAPAARESDRTTTPRRCMRMLLPPGGRNSEALYQVIIVRWGVRWGTEAKRLRLLRPDPRFLAASGGFLGADEETRTPNLLFTN